MVRLAGIEPTTLGFGGQMSRNNTTLKSTQPIDKYRKTSEAFGNLRKPNQYFLDHFLDQKITGAAGGDRTHDPRLRRPILYPLSYSRID